jgi:uncharacterized protein (UPF0276 family)
VIEMHIGGADIAQQGEDRYYVDSHGHPLNEAALALLPEVWRRATRPRALCLECEGMPIERVVGYLEKLSAIVGTGHA